MTILEKTTTVVITPVLYLCMIINIVTLASIRTNISAAILYRKPEINSYPISTLVLQNKGSNQSKKKLPQILQFTKLLKVLSLIQLWRVLKMKDKYNYSQVSNVQ